MEKTVLVYISGNCFTDKVRETNQIDQSMFVLNVNNVVARGETY